MAETVDVPKIGNVDKKWVWVAVAGAGTFVGIAWWRRYQASKSAAAVIDPATGSVGNTGFVNPNPVGPDSSVNQPPAAAANNQEWTQRVIADLGNIGLDASFVSAVIGKYLAGQVLTADEADIVRQAWAFEGKPPGGPNFINTGGGGSTPGNPAPPPPPPSVPPGETPKPVPTPPAPPPPTHRTYTVRKWPLPGSSLFSIAQLMYGNGNRWPDIYNANRALIGPNPNLIHPGQVLTIP